MILNYILRMSMDFPKSSTDNIKEICYGKQLETSRINATVSSNHLPKTTAYVRITQQSWQQGQMEGEVRAAEYQWRFRWHFRQGQLSVQPSLGRALIYEPLGRFLERSDYQLEPGGDYEFTLRSQL